MLASLSCKNWPPPHPQPPFPPTVGKIKVPSTLIKCAGKNAYSAGKTNGVLRGGALGTNRGYVLAHCGGGTVSELRQTKRVLISWD